MEADVIEAELRQATMLDLLYDHDRKHPGAIPDVVELLDGQYDRAHEDLWRGELRHLESRGLIKFIETPDFESCALSMTDRGREDVETRRARRADPAQRNSAARRALVRFLYGKPSHEAGDLQLLLSSPFAYFEGDKFTIDDLISAFMYLKRKEMIRGIHYGPQAIVRPRLTHRGIDCAEQFGGSVTDYLRRTEAGAGDTTVNFNAPVSGSNVAWNSRQIAQTATTSTGIAGDELASIIGAIKQALPVLGLSEEESRGLHGQLEVVEAELEGNEPDAVVVKSVLKRALGKIGNVAESSLGLLLTAYAKDLMAKAGVPLE